MSDTCNSCTQPKNTCGCSDPCKKSTCEEEVCGCKIEVEAACVRINKELECLGVSKGQTVEDVLDSIDEKLCSITSGIDGEDGEQGPPGEDGTDCECTEISLYVSESDTRGVDYGEGGDIGLWGDVNSPTAPSAISLVSTVYVVPIGGDGNYEILVEAHVENNADGGGGANDLCSYQIGFYKNGTREYYTACSVLSYAAPHNSMTLFVSNIPLIAGDIVDLRVAASNTQVDARFIDTRYKLTKLA